MPRLTIQVAGRERAACLIPRELTETERAALRHVVATLADSPPHGPESLNPLDPSPLESALLALLMQWRERAHQ